MDGKINLKDHTLTIGANGRIKAHVEAKEVIVAGELTGNVVADIRVEIASSGSMEGDIKAPRLILADGGRFKGGVDMSPKDAASGAKTSPFAAKEKESDNGRSSKIVPRRAEAGSGDSVR